MRPLLRELLHAHRNACNPRVRNALGDCGLNVGTGQLWGIDFVEIDTQHYQPTRGGKAAITGDFVLTAKEVNPVIERLRDGGIEVTAVQSHMLTQEPRLFFLHYWANADAIALYSRAGIRPRPFRCLHQRIGSRCLLAST